MVQLVVWSFGQQQTTPLESKLWTPPLVTQNQPRISDWHFALRVVRDLESARSFIDVTPCLVQASIPPLADRLDRTRVRVSGFILFTSFVSSISCDSFCS